MNTNYIPALKTQHDEIQKVFEVCVRAWREKQISEARLQLKNLLHLLQVHLQSESEHFFEKVRATQRLREGGPFCSYFFDFFMNNRPLVMAEKMITKRRGQKVKIEIPSDLNIFFLENSLLAIPLEEHLGIHVLCKELILALESNQQKEAPWIEDVFGLLRDLIESNQKKEETCLWIAVQQILEPKLLAELSSMGSSD